MKKEIEFIVGQKVTFSCWDNDNEKDMFGFGWIKEIDARNNQIIIQTTRRLIWVQTEGVSPLTDKN